ncbi:MAG TPA: aminoacetone oxidase family FAD-binding enzyme [Firmicutes bacterium]|nr:aminoacetone oxidase family FAD-binding enzyme [Bacillota bacterium]
MMTVKDQVIIMGGGAAGMLAAIFARRQGADVTILERNSRIGKKILATGNGRCNFTNINADLSCYYGNNPQFAYHALSTFGSKETIDFFEKLGIAHKVEDFGKAFPMSDQASSILDVLLYELTEMGVKIITNAYVKRIRKENNQFWIEVEDGSVFQGERVVLATGGKAMPSTGSDGNGYQLAKSLGHTIIAPFPALVQLKLEGSYFKQIQGVKLVGTAEILAGDKSVAKDRGDILFADYGVSGPPILQISRKAGELLQKKEEAILKLTIMDMMSKEDLTHLISERLKNGSRKTIEFCLVGLINKRLIPVLLKEAGLKDSKCLAGNVSLQEQEQIVNLMMDWRFKVRGTKSWPSAQVTVGGVDTREINPDTMESKLVKGLFFAGELVDIDGLCGGFNLQWAWSSGFIAGQNAAFML